MPRTTNADRILNESAMRLEAARLREALAQSQLNTAKAVLEAIQQAHTALENALTPKPRKKAEKSAPAQKDLTADKKVSDALCAAQVPTLDVPCGEPKDALIHDPKGGYASYHEFEGPKSVARAPRKSKPKETHSLSVAIEKDKAATAVGVSG